MRRIFLAPHVWLKPWSTTVAEKLLILICLFPCRLSVNEEFIPNTVFDLRLVPLFIVENFVVTYNPNGPKRDTAKKVPNFLGIFPQASLFPLEAIKVASYDLAEIMHYEHGPSPSPPNLDAIPKFMFD